MKAKFKGGILNGKTEPLPKVYELRVHVEGEITGYQRYLYVGEEIIDGETILLFEYEKEEKKGS
jgi:hypothetical protein